MHCPYCRSTDTRVVDSRVAEDGGSIRRRRTCAAESCGKRFTTVELMQLVVLKRSGATEPFTREKAISGVRKACKGRPVSEDELACLGQAVEDALRQSGAAEVPAHEVGLAILGPLRELDQVAYLRFASVYRGFESVDDFEKEIAALRRGAHERPHHPAGPDRLTPNWPGVCSGEAACVGPHQVSRTSSDGGPVSGPDHHGRNTRPGPLK